MAQKTETKMIDGIETTTTQLPATKAFALMPKLARLLAPAIEVGTINPEDDASKLVPVLGAMLGALDEKEAQLLLRECLSGTYVLQPQADGSLRKIDLLNDNAINSVFTGRLRAMLETVVFAIRVNFADFIVGLSSEARAKKPAAVAKDG